MIGFTAFALLASAAAPSPEPRRPDVVLIGPPTERDWLRQLVEARGDPTPLDVLLRGDAPEEPARDRNRTTSPTPRGRGGLRFNDWQAAEHEHVGRLAEQYARQPRADNHRISRGRP